MVRITEIGLEEWKISRILSAYRKLAKIDRIVNEGGSDSGWTDLTAFIESLLPAFAESMKDGELSEEYIKLRELVLSEKEDAEVEKALLMTAGSNCE